MRPSASWSRTGSVTPAASSRSPASTAAWIFPHQDLVCRGIVTRKWEENGEQLVELEIWTENDEGKKTTPGEAVVTLRA